jgi:hypothetical protein
LPNKRDHVRMIIERMRQHADSLEAHYFGATPHLPVKQSYEPNN